MKKSINYSLLYKKINQSVPPNRAGFRASLFEITQHKQHTPVVQKTHKGGAFMQLCMALTITSFVFIFSLNMVIGHIKSGSAEKTLQLELSQFFLNPSSELLYSEQETNSLDAPLNQLINHTN